MAKMTFCLLTVLSLMVLSWGVWELSAPVARAGDDIGAERTCCTYQIDCPENQQCKPIYPNCSYERIHICK